MSREPVCTLPGCMDGPTGRATRGRMDGGRQPVTTGRQTCDEQQLRRVVAGLSPADLEAWARGDTDHRVPLGCGDRAAQAARAEQQRRQNNATAAQAAAAHERAGGGTEARQTVPDTLTLPVVGEIPTTHALAAGAGLALLASGTDGGAALVSGGRPDAVGSPNSNGVPQIKRVDVPEDGDFYHVRVRQPGRFDKIRTPAWARRVSGDISKNSQVKMGRSKDSGRWFVQAVLIERTRGKSEADARRLARRIVAEIEDTDDDGDGDTDGSGGPDTAGSMPSPSNFESWSEFSTAWLEAGGDLARAGDVWQE